MDYISNVTQCPTIVGTELAFERLRYQHRHSPGAAILQTDCRVLPFRNGFFDVVIVSEVLHHIENKYHEKVLSEIKRVLRPGGVLWMLEPNRWHPLMITAGLILKADHLVFRFSLRKVCQVLKELGYKEIVVKPFNCYTYPGRKIYPEFLRGVVEKIEDAFERRFICTSYCIVGRS